MGARPEISIGGPTKGGDRMSATGQTAMQLGLMRCECCGMLSRPAPGAEEGHCPRCGKHVEFRKKDSLNRTLAYLIAAAICYIPANLLPIMRTKTLSHDESDTIMQGVVLLWSPASWPLSVIILMASILIPSAKIGALLYLVITVKRGSIKTPGQRVKLFRIVEAIGRWSMVDVFVVTFTAALIQLQPLMSVMPAPGILFFTAVVVLTMLAVEEFDPRLIWDPTSSKEVQHV
jgi:paraquat-inducible protein A